MGGWIICQSALYVCVGSPVKDRHRGDFEWRETETGREEVLAGKWKKNIEEKENRL